MNERNKMNYNRGVSPHDHLDNKNQVNMDNQISITIGGEKFVYDKTKYSGVSEVCEHCALKDLCRKYTDAPTLCECLDITNYNDYNSDAQPKTRSKTMRTSFPANSMTACKSWASSPTKYAE